MIVGAGIADALTDTESKVAVVSVAGLLGYAALAARPTYTSAPLVLIGVGPYVVVHVFWSGDIYPVTVFPDLTNFNQ